MERDAQLDALLRNASFDGLVQIVARGLPAGPDVEDAVQEAVVRAWLQTEDGRVLGTPKSWIVRTARNLVIDQLRRRRSEDRAIGLLRTRGVKAVAEFGLDLRLVAALTNVPPRQRTALELHYLEDLPVGTIAERMGTSIGTVKSQLHRGRRAIALALADERRGGDMEEQGWFMAGSDPAHYEARTSTDEDYRGERIVVLRSRTDASEPEGFGTLMQSIRADNYTGKRIQLSGMVKAVDIRQWSGLWMRIDPPGGGRHLAFDNMQDRPIEGTTDWQRYAVVLDVADQAAEIAFGILLAGVGEVHLADFTLEEVGRDIPPTGRSQPMAPANLDFSRPVSL